MSPIEMATLIRRIADHPAPMSLEGGDLITELLPLVRDVERELARRNIPAAARAALLAGLLLRAGDLDGAHRHAQAHEGDPRCDHWHAMMHRREGDFWNSAYWYRRVGSKTALPPDRSPIEFGDQVKARLESGTNDVADLVAWQRREWDLLLAACLGACGISLDAEDA